MTTVSNTINVLNKKKKKLSSRFFQRIIELEFNIAKHCLKEDLNELIKLLKVKQIFLIRKQWSIIRRKKMK